MASVLAPQGRSFSEIHLTNLSWIHQHQQPCLQPETTRGSTTHWKVPRLLTQQPRMGTPTRNNCSRKSRRLLLHQSSQHSGPSNGSQHCQLSRNIQSWDQLNQILWKFPGAKLPSKATEGSATYNLFPQVQGAILLHSCQLISTGLTIEIHPSYYGQISSQSGLSSNHLINIAARVINSDYRGVLKVLLHNHSDRPFPITPNQAITQILFLPLCPFPITPNQAITQILFLPLCPLLLEETQELSMMKRGTHGFGSMDIKSFQAEVLQLKPTAGQPLGTTFLGAQPSKATIRINSPDGPQTQIVIDSGSNILLVSSKLLDQLPAPPKPKEGQNIKINQVTRWLSTSQYVILDIHFKTSGNPVSVRLEAYVIKDMNTPIILGNDFADQYSLLIIRENGMTSLKLGDSRYSIPLDSVDSSYIKVQALQLKASKIQHWWNNCNRQQLKGPNRVYVSESTIIRPWTIGRIPIHVTRPLATPRIFMPLNQLARRLQNSTMIDSILPSNPSFLHITNDTDAPICFKASDSLGTIKPEEYFNSQPPPNTSHVQNFFNLITPILQSKEHEDWLSTEQQYQNQQPNILFRPKLVEVPVYEDISSQELLSSLDFNPKLLKTERSHLEQVVLQNSKAFSLNSHIGSYSDIKYSIKLKDNAKPILMLPYHASPEKWVDIYKQIDKWFSQGVICELESPWGALVIIIYCNGKARVCIDYWKVNAVTLTDEYPLPCQSDILWALSGSQWLSTFNVLSGFHQLEVVEEHRNITAFCTHKHGLLEFTQLLFGLCNGPVVFQRVMNKELAKFLWLFILVYIDDIMVYSQMFNHHVCQSQFWSEIGSRWFVNIGRTLETLTLDWDDVFSFYQITVKTMTDAEQECQRCDRWCWDEVDDEEGLNDKREDEEMDQHFSWSTN